MKAPERLDEHPEGTISPSDCHSSSLSICLFLYLSLPGGSLSLSLSPQHVCFFFSLCTSKLVSLLR